MLKFNKHLSTLILLSLIATSIHCMADTPTGDSYSDSSSPYIFNKKRDGQIRPKAPSMQHIEGYYSGETLIITFGYAEGECNLQITDISTGISQSYTIDSSELYAEVYVGELNGNYLLELTTAAGNSYSTDI